MNVKRKNKFMNIIVAYVLTMMFLITFSSMVLLWFKGTEPVETLKYFYTVCAVELLATLKIELTKEKMIVKEAIKDDIANLKGGENGTGEV